MVAPRSPRERGVSAAVVGFALAGVFAVTTVVLAIVAVGLQSEKDDLASERSAVQDVAARFAQAFGDYDYRDPSTFSEDLLPLSAPPFTDQLEDALPALVDSAVAVERTSSATVDDVFVAEVDDEDGTAVALVVYSAVETSIAGQFPLENVYMRLGMVRVDGSWRVNDVINLNFALAQTPAPLDGTPSAPPTSAPAG